MVLLTKDGIKIFGLKFLQITVVLVIMKNHLVIFKLPMVYGNEHK